MLKRILKTGAGALCAVAMLSSVANAQFVLNQEDDTNGVETAILQRTTLADGSVIQPNSRRFITIADNELIQDLSVTIEGLQHTFAGDLVAQLRKVSPTNTSSPGVSVIFSRINDGTENSDFNGNYTFTSTGGPTAAVPADLWATADSVGPTDVIPGSNSGVDSVSLYSAVNPNNVQVSLANAFRGQTTGGQWEFLLRDENENGITGAFTGVTLNFQTGAAAVPEPSTVSLLAITSLGFCMRRRRKSSTAA